MPKIKTSQGYKHIKELGGAIKGEKPSPCALELMKQNKIKGKILDYGCGQGFDVKYYGWEGYDPHYRQKLPEGLFNTIICNHVANILTRGSRFKLYKSLNGFLENDGIAYLAVSRRIPIRGKAGLRKRIQNWVDLTLPSIYYLENEFEIYEMKKDVEFNDNTQEFEKQF